jgi:hypothetical protein
MTSDEDVRQVNDGRPERVFGLFILVAYGWRQAPKKDHRAACAKPGAGSRGEWKDEHGDHDRH